MMGWMSVWMVIGLALFVAVVAGAVYLGIQLTQRDDEPGALEVLERRLASGEITPEEFAERQATLRGDPPPAT